MAIPKLLKTMRESLSGVEPNDSSTQLNFEDSTYFLNNCISLEEDDYSASISIFSDYDEDNVLNFLENYGNSTDQNVILRGIDEPVLDNDAANKAYVDNNGGTFTATYGTTTYAEIVAAFNQGKTVYCYNSSYPAEIFYLSTRPTGSNILVFYSSDGVATNNGYANTVYKYCQITSSSVWSSATTHSANISTSIFKDSTTPLSSTSGYFRPIRVSTKEPTNSDGNVGDIWIQYEE